jgi:mono/diheme cytochrome c family protein
MRRKTLTRLLIILSLLICLAVAPPARHAQRVEAPDEFNKAVQPFFSTNCYICHNSGLKSGGLDLEMYKTPASITHDRKGWEKVLQKLRTGEMPPGEMPRPDKAQLETVIRWIESEFKRSETLEKPDPGRVTARRLNRAEYNNSVRDLLGVDLRPADDFPQDDSGYGFDNIGDVLSLSPVLMEKYLAAAERVARTALFGPELLKPTIARRRPSGQRIVRTTTPLLNYDLTGLSLPNSIHLTHRFPVDGEYNFRVFLGGARPAGSEPLQLSLWVDGQQVKVIDFDPDRVASFASDRQEFGGMAQDFRTKIAAGEHWVAVSILRLYEGLPADYNGPNPSKRPKPRPPEFKPPPNLPPARIEELRKEFEARRAETVPANDARISALEVGGPYNQVKGPSPASLKLIYKCGHLDGNHNPSCARKIVADLARRAYRRPVTRQEINQLLSLIALARRQGDSLEEGIVLAIEAMVVSPNFLFRIEKDLPVAGAKQADAKQADAKQADAKQAHPISEHELASRLSYFLWSSMPDDELLGCADRGVLRQPDVLARQVARMLKDGRSRSLVENFCGQWLELRKLESVKPDRERFPDFDEYLLMSMRRESELFLDHIVRQDQSILNFIDANYTFLNERLARFYKIPGVSGPEFRKVDLTGTERGGVLTQASVLTVSSYATRTSPVLRGKWILENFLNAPPPPPPPDVPNLDEAGIGQSASLREQLEQHRKSTTCAACHARMDPLGFGLENFDATGAWRTRDGKFPIDSSGTLPDGRSFRGPQELKAILKADRLAFAEGMTEKLLTYALGRGLESYDRPTVRQIASRLSAEDYRFSTLVMEIVKSLPFQMRRGD